MKNIFSLLLLSSFLISCNEYSIIEGVNTESTTISKLSAGSFIGPPTDYNYSVQYTLFVKSDLNVGPIEVTYTLDNYGISSRATIRKYYPIAPQNCEQATESTVILDLRSVVNSNPNIVNSSINMTITAKAGNGKTFTKRVTVKVNYCYWIFLEAAELQ